jgi:hypothetical protein
MSGKPIVLGVLWTISCSLAFATGSTFQLTGTYLNSTGPENAPFQGPNFTLTFTLPDAPLNGGQGGLYPYYAWSGNIQYTDNGKTVYPASATLTLFPNPCWENCSTIGGFLLSLSGIYVPGDGMQFILSGPMLFSANNAMPIIPSGSYVVQSYGGEPAYSDSMGAGSGYLAGAQLTITTPESTVLWLSSLSPWSVFAGGPALTLTVNGTGFLNGATVLWSGSPLATTYVSSTQVSTFVPANLIASPGNANITVSNPGGALTSAVQFLINAPLNLTISTPAQLPSATMGVFYSQTLSVSGSVPPYTWSLVSGTLPSGLSLSSSGLLTGIPTATGVFTLLIRAADSYASSASRTFSLTVSDAACTYTLNTAGQAFTSAGGVGSIVVSAAAGCSWSVAGVPAWIMILSGGSGSGSGLVNYAVAPNSTNSAFSAALTIGGISFAIQEQGLTGLSLIGSMPHLAAEENWTTTFTVVNQSAVSATARVSLFGDAGDPSGNGPLMLPFTFPQQSAAAEPLATATVEQTIAPNASLVLTTAGPQTPPVLVGSAQLAATSAVDGFAIFHQIPTAQEAVVPLETRHAGSYLLPFDNTGGVELGVAVENVSAQSAAIGVVIRDDTGVVISSPGTTISEAGNGHDSFVLSQQYPFTANLLGTIEFDTPAGGQISALGIRFTPPNNALTTIPALANVGTGGGSIAHLASGGDGWQTTFVLVNTGTSAAQATLSFFADQTGAPLLLPLAFPQSGGGTAMTVSSYTTQLAAGASVVVVSSGALQLLTGSAQLSTTGNVSGFIIFRHNDQEAVVPLESRNANAYVIAFDNTNGTSTGVAVNAVSTEQVSVPVTVRNDAGMVIANDSITLAPNGHYAFTLGTDRYPAALTIRGTIEFDTPSGAAIGALGIRIPAGAAHTYTTLPALSN